MLSPLIQFLPLSLLAQHGESAPAAISSGPAYAWLIPFLPLLAAILCGTLALTNFDPRKSKLPAYLCIAGLFFAFLTSLGVVFSTGHSTLGVHVFDWINVAGFKADFAFYLDPLTSIMLMVVTGIGTLVALYASEYMFGDRGYARFFAFVSLFIVAMTCLVLADNLVLLYLGWEGVGLCSYLLIGFYYDKPAAVAAAKKAFIVNRIGDLGFALGIWLIYVEFGTVEFAPLLAKAATLTPDTATAGMQVIPFLLMLGAFGKSAQLPLYVWLPDAMEGPTPVSALIHAATMVTAGVYMIARLIGLFALSTWALPTVAWVGGLTALFAASIALCQYDIKRIFAYSTVSQLGYMFMGLGVCTTTGATFHLFTHAFFKAVLFLGSGAVMHGLAGQLDLRRISGLGSFPGWKIVMWTMLIGCLALAGFPGTSGYFSKDMILAQALITEGPGFGILAVIGLLTAFCTAYYTFRVFFRVFLGHPHIEPGDHGGGGHGGHEDHSHFHPHAPGPAINTVLVVLAIGGLLAGYLGLGGSTGHGWFGGMIHGSTAGSLEAPHAEGHTFWSDPHKFMFVLSALIGLAGIALAWYFHLANRAAADGLKKKLAPVPRLLENKWGVDEGYDVLIRKPLLAAGHLFYQLGDNLLINGLVELASALPRAASRLFARLQRGVIPEYGLGMSAGLALLIALVWYLS